MYGDAMEGFLDLCRVPYNSPKQQVEHVHVQYVKPRKTPMGTTKPVAKVVINNICGHKSRGPQSGFPSMLGHPIHNHGG